MIQLIGLDVDGTILDSKGQLTAAVREAIRATVAQGIQIAIVSGRNLQGIRRIMELLDLDLLYISSGGAVVSTGFQKTIISQRFLDLEDARKMIRVGRSFGSGIFVEMPDGLYWEGTQSYLDWLISLDDLPIHIRTDLLQDIQTPPLKLTIVIEHQRMTEIWRELERQQLDIHTTFSSPVYMEITRKGIDKGQALKILAEYLQIPLAQVAAIGDAENDLAMFQVSGTSVAMGNAPEHVQRTATLVAPSNDEDGLAWALKLLVEQNERNE